MSKLATPRDSENLVTLLPCVGLGLVLWEGDFQGLEATWLRWCDEHMVVIPTGAGRAEREAEQARLARARADKLEARLRSLGIDPDES